MLLYTVASLLSFFSLTSGFTTDSQAVIGEPYDNVGNCPHLTVWQVNALIKLNSPQISQSWHVQLASYDTSGIPVISMQANTPSSQNDTVLRLEDYDLNYAKELYTNSGLRFDPPKLDIYPNLRDSDMSLDGACVLLQRIQEYEPSTEIAILLDNQAVDDTCIIVHWRKQQFGQPLQVDAARVKLSRAIPIVNLLSTPYYVLRLILGTAEYAASKVDVVRTFTGGVMKPSFTTFDPSAHIPEGLSLCGRDVLTVISLLPEGSTDITSRVSTSSSAKDEVNVVYLKGNHSSTRSNIYDMYEYLENYGSESIRDKTGYAFFVDNLLKDETGEPAFLAVSRTSMFTTSMLENEIQVVPIKAGKILELWRATLDSIDELEREVVRYDDDSILVPDYYHSAARAPVKVRRVLDHESASVYANTSAVEQVVHPREAWSSSPEASAPVWFLRNFTDAEERIIRSNLARWSSVDNEVGFGKAFSFMGYRFPDDGKSSHTLQDLADLWQKSDAQSPRFDANYAELKMSSYPHHFIAIDDLALDPDAPIVRMGTTVDFWAPNNFLGWRTGLVDAEKAYITYLNFDIGNTGHDEGLRDVEQLWLSDLSNYRRTHKESKDPWEIGY